MMNNPGPSITERAALLARQRHCSFRDALRELSRRGHLRRKSKRQNAARCHTVDPSEVVSRLERQKLF